MHCPEERRKEEDHREGSGHKDVKMVGVTQEEGDREGDYWLIIDLKAAVK